jgi:hypothetical protein
MKTISKLVSKPINIILLIYSIISILSILYFDGTAGGGDSIAHFLYAKYAPMHLELYLDHWAKPIFVLLASPFAQFGFVGVKVFNSITTFFTIYFTFRISELLGIKNAYLSSIILIFTPLYYIITFSGLTEPLFALALAVGTFYILKRNFIIATIIISFLPFIRSEGLIIIGVFVLYFIVKKLWQYIPLFGLGHAIYSIIGYFKFGDLLWVFNKIPYARLSSNYGNGDLFHFVHQLFYLLGTPIYLFFCVGLLAILWSLVKRNTSKEILLLVFLGFLSFFTAHTMFWYLGIFNSMGLKRVFIAIIPFISIITLMGFNFVSELIGNKHKHYKIAFQIVIICLVVIFPFTKSPSAINWEKDMRLSKDQLIAEKVFDRLEHTLQKYDRYVFAHPYYSVVMEVDYFDNTKRINLTSDFGEYIKEGDLILWDSWYAVVEGGLTYNKLQKMNNLKEIYKYSTGENNQIELAIFEPIPN